MKKIQRTAASLMLAAALLALTSSDQAPRRCRVRQLTLARKYLNKRSAVVAVKQKLPDFCNQR
jgi:hypothetical protein